MAHPDLPQTAAELVELYQQKDAMEKDFETMVPPLFRIWRAARCGTISMVHPEDGGRESLDGTDQQR